MTSAGPSSERIISDPLRRRLRRLLGVAIREPLRRLGFDLARLEGSTRRTLLGLSRHPIRTVLDVGANTGQFAREILHVFPEARVVCFEPLPGPHRELERWAAREPRARVLRLALGRHDGEAEMLEHVGFTPSSSLLPSQSLLAERYPEARSQIRRTVRVARLDTAVRDMPPLGGELLVKLDVQGYEDRVIAGGRETLARARACLVEIALDPFYEGQATFREICEALWDLGLEYRGNLHQAIAEDGHVMFLDALFVRP